MSLQTEQDKRSDWQSRMIEGKRNSDRQRKIERLRKIIDLGNQMESFTFRDAAIVLLPEGQTIVLRTLKVLVECGWLNFKDASPQAVNPRRVYMRAPESQREEASHSNSFLQQVMENRDSR